MEAACFEFEGFLDDHSLSADPRNLIAAAGRSAPPWVILPRSCDGDCLAFIPYHIDRVCTLGFFWPGEDAWGTHAVLTDDQGIELAVIEPGAPEMRVDMNPGDYVIIYTGHKPTSVKRSTSNRIRIPINRFSVRIPWLILKDCYCFPVNAPAAIFPEATCSRRFFRTTTWLGPICPGPIF